VCVCVEIFLAFVRDMTGSCARLCCERKRERERERERKRKRERERERESDRL